MEKALMILLYFGTITHQAFGDLHCEDGQLRLVDGNYNNSGRLEACYHNEWGTVCSQWFDINDARVACSKLGFDGTKSENQYSISTTTGPTNTSIVTGFLQCSGTEADFLECNQNLGRAFLECSHSDAVLLTCPTTGCSAGDIRLVGGNVGTEGTLEICYNEAWNAICADSFGQADAFVACRELGYPTTNVEVVTEYRINDGHGNPILLTGFDCYGNEATLYDCSRDNTCEAFDENNSFFKIVGIKCNGDVEPACTEPVRLVDGPSSDEGRLEYCLNGAWGTVGSTNFDIQDGQVACKGFVPQPARVKVYRGGKYGMGSGGVYFDEVDCIGSEPSILNCPSNTDTRDHDHYNDVAIQCIPRAVSDCTQNDIRLSNDGYSGRVEVCNSDEWGSICSQEWDRNDAMVVCRQLGFGANSYASYYTESEFGDGDLQMFASAVACTGAESNLYGTCTKNDAQLPPSCIAGKTAGVRCFEPQNDDECEDGQIRLNPTGDSNREGEVQICLEGVWGFICPGGNDVNNAEVICRELGYESTWSVFSTDGLFDGSQDIGPIMYDSFNCSGNEDSLANCPYSEYGQSNPECRSILGVQCQKTVECIDGSIRLQQGDDDSEGRVEVCTDDTYATIDDDSWDQDDARVVCSQLGSYHAPWSVAVTGNIFSNGKKRVTYSSVGCTGDEDSLSNCDKYVHSKDDPIQAWYYSTRAGVECQEFRDPDGCTDGEMHLVRDEQYNNLDNEREGRFEICIGGYWATFCTKDWTAWDTAAACRSLGYETLNPRLKFSGQGSGPVYYSPGCGGFESNILTECNPSNNSGINNCGHFSDVGIECPTTAAPYYSVSVVPATEGPYSIGSNISVQCVVEPEPPTGYKYDWWSLVTDTGNLYSDPSSSWAVVYLDAGAPSFGHLYCAVYSEDDVYGIGVARLNVQGILAPIPPEVESNVGGNIVLTIDRTDHAIISKLLNLNWYYEGTKITELMEATPNKYSISDDWLTLTINGASWEDAGYYHAQYDSLSLYSFDEGCEKLSIDILRNFPVMSVAIFAVSVGDAKFSHSGEDSLFVINPDYQTFTRDTEQVQFFITRHASLRDSALKIRTSHDGALPVKLTSNIPYSRVDLSHLTLFDEGFYESELVLSLNEILTNSGCDSSFGTQYKRFFNEYLNMGDEISIGYSLARLQYYEYPNVTLNSDKEFFMSNMDADLTCSPWGGYPLHHAISISKNGQVVDSAITYGDSLVYTTSNYTVQKYGTYWCTVDNTVVQSRSSVLVQEATKFNITLQVDSCILEDKKDDIEMGLTKRFEEACDCSLEGSMFWQSSLVCDEEMGYLNVSTIFVYSNNDGDITASSVIDRYNGEISRGVNLFVRVNGERLGIGPREEPTEEGLSTGAITGIVVGVVVGVLIMLVIVIIVIAIIFRYRRRVTSKDDAVTGRSNVTYDAKEEKTAINDDDDDDDNK